MNSTEDIVLETKMCTKCETILPITDFTLKRAGGTARRPECKECRKKRESTKGIQHELLASSWKIKQDDEAIYVDERNCPIQREEGKQSKNRYPYSQYGLYKNPIIIECCCKEWIGGRERTPTCPHFVKTERVKREMQTTLKVHCQLFQNEFKENA